MLLQPCGCHASVSTICPFSVPPQRSHALQRARIEEYGIRLAQLDGNYTDSVACDPLFDGSMTLPLKVDWLARPNAARLCTRRSSATNIRRWRNQGQFQTAGVAARVDVGRSAKLRHSQSFDWATGKNRLLCWCPI